jgi:hypothetical protein
MQSSATFLYNSTAVGQLRNIPGNANHSHEVFSTINIICSTLPRSYTTPQPWDRNIPGNVNYSHRVLSTTNIICSTLPRSYTTPQPWDSSATYLGMSIIHIENSLLKTSYAALGHFLVQLHSCGTAPQHTWECQSFTQSTLYYTHHMQHFATFLCNLTAIEQLRIIPILGQWA